MKVRQTGCFGFTLVELLVVIMLMAVMTTMAVPVFSAIYQSLRLTSAINSLFSGLILARSEAIKTNSRSVICKSLSGDGCTMNGEWEQGWIVFQDTNGNAIYDVGEKILLRQPALGLSIKFSTTNPVKNYVSYAPTGAALYVSGAFQAGTFTVCHQSTVPSDARQILIGITGRPRTVRTLVSTCT